MYLLSGGVVVGNLDPDLCSTASTSPKMISKRLNWVDGRRAQAAAIAVLSQ